MIRQTHRARSSRQFYLATAAATALLAWAGQANALPPTTLPAQGTSVANGASPTFTTNGSDLLVTQNSSRVVINWNSFNIGSAAQVTFAQPTKTAIAFNVVPAGVSTEIDGKLSANGGIWLFSPAGILFGAGSEVTAGSFLASTGVFNTTSQSEALNGATNTIDIFPQATPGQGSITVAPANGCLSLPAANIDASSGFVLLHSPTIDQEGSVTASDAVVYNADEGVTVQFAPASDNSNIALVSESSPGDLPSASHITVGGTTHAGTWVEADAAEDTTTAPGYGGVINLTGTISATGMKADTANPNDPGNGFSVILDGDDGGISNTQVTSINASSGTIDASSGIYANAGSISTGSWNNTGGAVQLSAGGADGIDIDPPLISTGPGLVSLTGTKVILDSDVIAAGSVLVLSHDVTVGPNVTVEAGRSIADSSLIIKSTGDITADPTSQLFVGPALGTPTGPLSVLAGATVSPADGSFISQTYPGTGGDLTLGYATGSTVTLQAMPLNNVGGTIDLESSVQSTGSVLMSAGLLTLGTNSEIAAGQVSNTADPGVIVTYSGSANIVLQNATKPAANPVAAGDIVLAAPVNTTDPNALTFQAWHALTVTAPITDSGTGEIGIITNAGINDADDYSFTNGGSLTFTGPADDGEILLINGKFYTLIFNQTDLLNINNNLGGYYALAAPLDFTSTNTNGISGTATVFTAAPIANLSNNPFTGHFTGLGNTISNLNINADIPIQQFQFEGGEYLGTNGQVGLFGSVASGAVVRDVNLVNATVIGGDGMQVGALVGHLDGTVENDTSSGQISTGNSVGSAYGFAAAEAGGLVGQSYGSILNSSSSATVSAQSGFAGGLVGVSLSGNSIASSIVNSSASGAVSVGDSTGSGAGTAVAGGLVGLVNGLEMDGSTVDPITVSGSHATGAVSGGAGSFVGGFVGDVIDGQVTTSYATGLVTQTEGGANGDNDIAGGFAGLVATGGSVTQSYASGAVQTVSGPDNTLYTQAGGFVGDVDLGGSVSDDYSLGAVTATGGAFSTVGGFAGSVREDSTASGIYATGHVAGSGFTGGLVAIVGDGDPNSGPPNNAPRDTSSISDGYWDEGTTGQTTGFTLLGTATSAPNITGIGGSTNLSPYAVSTYANFGTDLTTGAGTWVMIPGETRPMLSSEFSTTITNAHQLQLMALNLGDNYTLANNIDASETTSAAGIWNPANGFVPVGGNPVGAASEAVFTGTFNGQGYTISNLAIKFTTADQQTPVPGLTTEGVVGLFGFVGPTGVLENVNLTGAQITAGDGMLAGALAGGSIGLVTNASSSGSVTVGNEINTGGGITAAGGGLVGGSAGTITNSTSSATVVGGDAFVGGLLGTQGTGGLVAYSSASGAVSVTSYPAGFPDSPSAGGLVGEVDNSTVAGSFATGAVSGGAGARIGGLLGSTDTASITTSYATGDVTQTAGGVAGSNSAAGGFVGSVNDGSTITQSWASGDVNSVAATTAGTFSHAGGFAGDLSDSGTSASEDYALGSVTMTGAGAAGVNRAGGFAGAVYNSANVDDVYATGLVTGASGVQTAGLVTQVGSNNGGGDTSGGTVTNSYWDEGTTGQMVGANIETPSGGVVTNVIGIGGMTGPSPYSQATYANFDFTGTWFMVEGSTRPILQSEYSTDITNAHQLQLMDMNLAANYTLGNDINASGTSAAAGTAGGLWNPATGFSPVGAAPAPIEDTVYGPFTGTFNGQGHTISNLAIIDTVQNTQSLPSGQETDGAVGLFGFVGSAGVIQNVNLANVNVTGGDGMEVGALAGDMAGTVVNASSSGKVTVGALDNEEGSDARGGGLIGELEGTVQNSSSSAAVTGGSGALVGGLLGEAIGESGDVNAVANGSFATGSVVGGAGSTAGGFIGFGSNFTANFSYATGSVTQTVASDNWAGGFAGGLEFSTINSSFASGPVSTIGSTEAPALAGGFVGNVLATAVTNAYSSGSVTANGPDDVVGGFAGSVGLDSVVTNILATGAVNGPTEGGLVGGLFGKVTNASQPDDEEGANPSITNAYWDSSSTGQSSPYNPTDLTGIATVTNIVDVSSDPYNPATYATPNGQATPSFDFTNVWSPPSAGTYPQLYGASHVMLLTGQGATIVYGNFPVYTVTINGLQGGDPASSVANIGALPVTYVDGTPFGPSIANSGYYDVAYSNPTPPDGVPPPYSVIPSASGATGGTGAYRIVLNDGGQAATDAGIKAGTLEIDPAPLTLAAVYDDRTYDGDVDSSANPSVTGLVGFDGVSNLSQSYDQPNVGNFHIMSINPGYTVDDGNNGYNYTVTEVQYGDGSTFGGEIDPAPLTVSLSETDKVYDTTDAATVSYGQYQLNGGFGDVSLTETEPTSGAYGGANVGSYTVTVDGVTLEGPGLNNYSFDGEATGPGSITPAPLTLTAVTDTKTYDGTTYDGLTPTESGLLGNDSYTATQSFNSKNVILTGSTISVDPTYTITNGVDGGNGAGNYNIMLVTAPGTINPAPLTITATFNDKTYDGDATAAATPTVGTSPGINGLYSVDSISGLTESYTSKDVNPNGNTLVVNSGYTISDANGPDAENYTVTLASTAGEIDPYQLTASLTGTVEKTYDTTTSANLASNNYSLSPALNEDDVSLVAPTGPGSGTYDSANAGFDKTVTVAGLTLTGEQAEDYALPNEGTVSGAVGQIDKAPLTLTAVSDTKTYDGTTSDPGITPTEIGLLGNDSYTATQSFDSKNVILTGSTISVDPTYTITNAVDGGNGAGNYDITLASAPGTINPAPLTLTATFNSKVYDGGLTATAAPTPGSTPGINGLYTGDNITGLTESYTDKNVAGADRSTLVVNSGYTISDANGDDSEDYTVSTVNALGTITPAPLTVTLVAPISKTYDGGTNATLTDANYKLNGVIGPDVVNLNDPTSGTYDNRNAGTGKTVTVAGLQISGDDSEDYKLSSTTAADPVGIIIPAPLTLTAVTDTKTYDGGVTAAGTPTNSALIEGDSISDVTQSFTSKNVLGTNGSSLLVTGYTIDDGNDGNNYAVTLVGAKGTINPAPLTIAAVTDTKTYDGTTASDATPTVATLLGGDTITGLTQTFGTKNAGAQTLSVAGYTINDGNDGNNYVVTTTTAAGEIDPKTLDVSLIGNVQKAYDGNTNATLTSGNYDLSGVVSGDTVSLNDPTSGTYDTPAAGTLKLVTVGGLAISGADAANYIVNGTAAGQVGTITAPPQTLQITVPTQDVTTPGFLQTATDAAAGVQNVINNTTTVVNVFPVGNDNNNGAQGDNLPITGAGNRDLWTGSDDNDQPCPPGAATPCPPVGGSH